LLIWKHSGKANHDRQHTIHLVDRWIQATQIQQMPGYQTWAIALTLILLLDRSR
jgi:hypothetical protein